MTRAHVSWAFTALMCLWTISGCSDPQDNNQNNTNNGVVTCTYSADCPDGQRCQGSVCTTTQTQCTQDAECALDEYCKTGTCALSGCADDAACADGAICDTTRPPLNGSAAGSCRAGCRMNSDCGDGQVCNSINRCEDGGCTTASCSPLVERCDDTTLPARCLPTGKCNGDADCVAYGQLLMDGKDYVCDAEAKDCIERPPCVSDEECGIARICDTRLARPACVVGCRDRSDCALNEVCDPSQLKCVSGCATEADCKLQGNPDQAYLCENLLCIEICAGVDDCALDGQVCTGTPSICQGCTDDSQCPSTQFCDFTKGSNQQEIDDPRRGLCVNLPPDCPDDAYGNNHALDRFYTIANYPFVTDGAANPQPLFCQDKPSGEWFKITAQPGSVITASVEYAPQGTNLDLNLLTTNGTRLVSSNRSPNNGDMGYEELRYGVNAGGEFLLQVGGTTTEKNLPYKLSVNVAPPGACVADALEPNNAAVDAAPLMPGMEYTGLQVCNTDRDFYRLDVGLNQIVTVVTDAPARLGDVDLFIYKIDAMGNLTPVVDSQTRADTETVQFQTDAAGTYIAEVVVSQGFGNIDYKIEWNQRVNNCTDVYEPNDTCGNAVEVAAGSYMGINLCTDEDWYKVTLLPQQRIVATARYNPRAAAGLVTLRVRGPNDCAFIAAIDSTETIMGSNEIQQKVEYTALQGGTFYITASLAQGLNVPYLLTLDIIDGPACLDDQYEGANGNNDLANATMIDRAQALNGLDNAYVGLRTCDADEDRFKIALLDGDVIRWEIKHRVADGDLDAEILKADGTVVATSATTTDDETISYTVPAGEAGVYQLRVFPKFPVRLTYRLLTTLNTVGPVDPLCPDLFENNDTRPTAKALVDGTYSNLSACSGDQDWYTVQLAAGDVLNLTMTHDSAAGNIQLAVFDELNTSATPTAQVVTNDNIKTISFVSPRDQVAVIRLITGANVSLSAYTLDVDVVSTPCVDDSLEPNDAVGVARPVAAPGLLPRLNKCEDDEDWYRVSVPAGRRAAVHVNYNATGRVDFDLQVFSDAAGMVAVAPVVANANNGLAVQSPTAIGAETFEWQNTGMTTQTYYVRVLTKTRARQGYDLMTYIDNDGDGIIFAAVGGAVDIGDGPEDRACPDLYENNDASAAARAIQVGALSDLLLCNGSAVGFPNNDPDWYSVFVPAGATLTANATFAHADGDIDIDLFRATAPATSLASGNSTTDNEQASVTNASTGENYLIRVQGKSQATRFSSYYGLTTALSFSTPCTPNAAAGRDKAGAVATMGGAFNALTMCENTQDWFALTLAAGDTVIAGLEVNNRFGDLSIALLNSADVVLASSDVSANVQEIDHTVSAAGTYYLRVTRKNDAFFRTTYDLWLATDDLIPDAPFCPDNAERNDTLEEAAALNFSTQKFTLNQIMCGADQDFYALGSLTSNTEYVVSAFFNATMGADVDLQVVNAAGMAIPLTAGTGTAAGNDEHITVRPTLTGNHFLRVTNKVAMNPGAVDYHLFINNKLGTCPEDSFEPNNTSGQAKQLPSAQSLYGLYSCHEAATARGEEFFRVTATRAGTLRVVLMHDPAAVDFLVRVFNENAGTLRTATSTPGRKTFEAMGVSAGDSFEIQISNSNATSGPYILQIEN